MEIIHRTLPGAGLPDPAVALDRIAHGPALAEAVEERLFSVNIEPGPGEGDGEDGVPVVGDGDGDGIEVAAQAELAEVRVDRAVGVPVFFIDDRLGLHEVLFVQVADGHPLDLVLAEKGLHVGDAHHAEPDSGHDDAVGRRDGARAAEGRGPNNRRESGGAGGGDGQCFQKLAALHPLPPLFSSEQERSITE
jgi:hypothetical protein